eukprot:1035224-Amphidinium_carterae.1
MATMAGATLTSVRAVWRKAFAENQSKLVAAEKAMTLLHLAPLHLVLPHVGQEVLTEVLITCLIWGNRGLPQDQLEEVILCVPAAMADETTGLVTLPLFGSDGDIIGECNACYLSVHPQFLESLIEVVSVAEDRETVTFSGHPAGGAPRAAEAFTLWRRPPELEHKSFVYLDGDTDTLRAHIHGQSLEGEVFLSAGEEEDAGSAMALAILGQAESAAAETLPPPPAASQHKGGAPGTMSKKAASLAPPSLVSPPPKGVLLAEQEVYGIAERLRAQKAKATAKSSDVGELASA